jgi:hypothetical protein
MAPPSTRAVIHSSPLTRTSWGPRGIDAWYCGPSENHYRCCNFYVPETRAMQVSGSYELFPVHCQLPTLTPLEHTQQVANELVCCMEHLPRPVRKRLFVTMLRDLRQHASAPTTYTPACDPATVPWGGNKGAQPNVSKGAPAAIPTSTNPTAPHIVRTAPHIDWRQTRANTPPQTPTPPVPLPTTPPVTDIPAGNIPSDSHVEPRRSPQIALLSPQHYSQAALAAISGPPPSQATPTNCHFCAPVTHPITGETITHYKNSSQTHLPHPPGRRRLGKNLGTWRKATPKQTHPAQTPSMSCPSTKFQTSRRTAPSHMRALSLIIDHKRLIPIVSASLPGATSLPTQENLPHEWQTSPQQKYCGTV